MPRVAW